LKSDVGSNPPGVRIPHSPPNTKNPHLVAGFFMGEIFSDLILSVSCNYRTFHKNLVMSRFIHKSLVYIKG